MKIAFFDPSRLDYVVATPRVKPLGGGHSALCYLAEALARLGHEVTLINYTTTPGRSCGVECVRVDQTAVTRYADFDVVIVFNVAAPGVFRQIRTARPDSRPLVLWSQHNYDQPAVADLADRSLHDRIEGSVLVSDWQAAGYRDAFGMDAGKIRIIGNAIAPDFENLFPDPRGVAAHKPWPPVLCYTSTPFRGLDVLLESFPRIREAIPGTRLRVFSSMSVYGVGADHDPYAALYERCRSTEGVEYEGSVSQTALARELKDATCLAYPSTFAEGYCISVLEAMAAGCVVVTSDLGALRDTTAGFGHLLAPHPDREAHARLYAEFAVRVLTAFRSSPREQERLAEQVMSVNRTGTWSVRAKQWEAWLQGLVTRSGNPASSPAPNLDAADKHYRAGRLQEAETACRRMLEREPANAEAHARLGDALLGLGNTQEAERCYRQAVALDPGHSEAHCNLGVVLYGMGRLEEAAQCYRRALELNPRSTQAYNNLGSTLLGLGQAQEAEDCYRRAIALSPDNSEVHCNLGVLLYGRGRLEDAARCHRRALALNPRSAEAYNNLGTALTGLAQCEEAEHCFRQALALDANHAQAHNNLGVVLQDDGRLEEAGQSYRQALVFDPDYAEAHNNLGYLLTNLGQLEAAERSCRRALALKPDYAEAHHNLGNALQDLGRLEEAEQSFRRALSLKPDYADAHSNVLFMMDLIERYDTREQQAERRRWYEQHGKKHAQSIRAHENVPDPERRLRIGYVSADFRRHAVSTAFAPVICLHERAGFEVICYSGVKREDEVTARLRAAAEGWRSTVGVSDDALAEQIRADRIDILVDLTAHMAGNRLLVFARKPAPVQVSAWGSAPGTGLETIDYVFADAVSVPREERVHFAEEVIDLPCALCYEAPSYLPEVSGLPALEGKPFTFGCINRPEKISERVVGLWGRILAELPGTRLLVKGRGLGDAGLRASLLGRLGKAGIAPDRVRLEGTTAHAEHLRIFHEVDLVLDPYPHGGGISTGDALAMGVPVVTLAGTTPPSRIAAFILTALGMPEWIARSDEEYVRLAVRAAQDLPKLAEVRAGLRQRMLRSPFGDVQRYTRAVEDAYRTIWRRWCERQGLHKDAAPTSRSDSLERAMESALQHHRAGRLAEAESLYREVLERQPEHAEALHFLGVIDHQCGNSEQAVERIEHALELAPSNVVALGNLGEAYRALGRTADAERCLRQALALKPDYPEAHNLLGYVLKDTGRLRQAEQSYRQAIALRPDYANAYGSLGNLLKDFGRSEEAEQCFRRALNIEPDHARAHSNLIFMLDFMERFGVREQQAERRRWYERHGKKHARAIRAHGNVPDPGRRLRIGYVSADFRRHSASFAFAPVICLHDRARFEVICYSAVKREDEVTARLRAAVEGWKGTLGISDDALAEQIRGDRIDILVDLSGHSAGNRLLVFARKPAPVQVAAWGAAPGTGLATIDYLFADPVALPPGERVHFAEEVIDLPCMLCYEPPRYLPEVSPLPALSGKPFTFGCVSRLEKISGRVIGLWGRILAALPGARLLVKDRWLDDGNLRDGFLGRLRDGGVAPDRVRLEGGTTHAEHLKIFHEVDVVLDPYPHGGGIGTAEALAMGVPVLTLLGATLPSRLAASILTVLGMPEWIARTDDEYVRCAVQAAQDLSLPAQARAGLRQRMLRSPVGDVEHYTRAVEQAYRAIWRRWCERQERYKDASLMLRSGSPGRAMALALEHHRAGRLAEAGSLYREVLESQSEHAEALHFLGVIEHQCGESGQAVQLIERALRLAPSNAVALSNLGEAYRALGRTEDAERCLRRALALKADYPEAHNNLGLVLFGRGRPEEAEQCYRRALAFRPELADVHSNLGNALKDLGRLQEAEHCYRHALALDSGYSEAHFSLGIVLYSQGRLEEAESSYRGALALNPGFAEAHNNLGNVLNDLGRPGEAEQSFRRALALKPDFAEAHGNLGNTLKDLGRLKEAEQSFREALSLNPDSAEAHHNLGTALKDLGRLNEAEQSFRAALAINPDLAETHNNLGIALNNMERLKEAEQSYRQALALKPDSVEANNNLGGVLKDSGRLEEAEQSFRRALALKPDYSDAHSNVIFMMDLLERHGVREQQAERRHWYEQQGKKHAPAIPRHENVPDPGRRLRIGYVSADFRRHAACTAFAPLICLHDRAEFEVICYSGVVREDEVTARLRAAAEGWTGTVGVSDDALAEQIRGDGIDILVDLSAHMAGNRLLVFARKPAPVQVTAWGSAPGTGLATMDYLFADPVSVPLEERGHFAEEVIDLPCALCYEAPPYLPEVSRLPALEGRPFTFGCVNRPEKISERVIGLWGRVLGERPGARLLIKGRGLGDAGLRASLLARLSKAGIAPDRVRLEGTTAHAEHLKIFHEVDLVLDPYPHGGGISTGEALAMGVPVVTLAGATPPSRIAAFILTALGMPEWVAHSDDEYVHLAVQAARDLERLAEVRAGLRQRLLRSPFGDVQRYTRAVEDAYRTIWRRWCERQGQRGNAELVPQEGSLERAMELALEHHRAERFAEAEHLYREVLERQPEHAEAWHFLGLLAHQCGDSEQAVQRIERSLALAPSNAVALSNLGGAYRALGRTEDAERCLRQALLLRPDYANAHGSLGNVLKDLGRLTEAEQSYRKALEVKPGFAKAYNNLGYVLKLLGRSAEAERSFREALALRPGYADAHVGLGNLKKDFGRVSEAEQSFRRALVLDPHHVRAHSNLIFTRDFLERYGVREQQAERRRWYERHGKQHAPAIRAHENVPDPGRRLRIGYVSADFRRHSASFIFAPIICRHDRAGFEVTCYSGVGREDQVTARLRAAAEGWRSTVGISDDALSEQIRADRIDILVDLSGHSAGNRLLVFARKPAPVQVAAWGGAPGTGLETMDYLFADPVALPPQERVHFAEEVLDLPCTLCYEPPAYLPEVSELPALVGRAFTFGCINRLEKISDRVMDLWRRVLAEVPGGCLLVKDRGLDDTDLRNDFLGRLGKAGIAPERVQLRGPSLHPEHMRIFREVDLALDPYPHGGGCSTAEALSMGVPVVTLEGATLPGRIAASILTVLGMPEWIARTDEEYVRIAVQAARELPRLAEVRAGLRQRILRSPFGDVERYTRAVEDAYRTIWRRWCEGQGERTDAAPLLQNGSLKQAMALALEQHRAGRLAQAERLYLEVLERQPEHAEAWHFLGVIAHQYGSHAQAVERIERSLALAPSNAVALSNLGEVYRALGRTTEAERSLRQALALNPDYPEAHNNLGLVLSGLGRAEQAEQCFRRALAFRPDLADVHNNLGNALKVLGKLHEAGDCYRQGLALDSGNSEAHCNLGDVLYALGRPEDAEQSYRRALELKPDFTQAHNNLGNALHDLGRLEEAEDSFLQALVLEPGFAEAHNNLGNALKALGRLQDAEQSFRAALAHKPDLAEARNNLGVAQRELGRLDEAEQSYRQALALKPDFAEAHHNLGNALKALGRLQEAEQSFRAALAHKPDLAEARNSLGIALRDQGRLKEAEQIYRQALVLKPDYAEARNNLGVVLQNDGRLKEAEQSYREALVLRPGYAEAHCNLGNVLSELERLEEAEQICRRALELNPGFAEGHCNLGNVLKGLGRVEEAEQSFLRALALQSDYADAHSNLIFAIDLIEHYGVKEQQAERRRWYERHGKQHAQAIRAHENVPDPGRRLRIGYVSADFRRHSASFAFAPIIGLHDRAVFEVICYSGVVREDEVTARLRAAAEGWRSTVGTSDDALAEQIRADRIDILVDLSGHSGGDRLLVFARKPAPVQVTAWGHATGTGLETMDYLFADPVFLPLQERAHFAEEVIDLPCTLCYEPPAYLPEVSELPALSGRPFTFGCVNRPEKISDRVIALWGRILGELTGARLLVKGYGLGSAGLRASLLERFGKAGIAPERVQLLGTSPHQEHMRIFRELDLAFDPYPHGGGCSTAEALSMGVPVVTLEGATPPGRIAASILTVLGMSDWIARTDEEYVGIAVRMAQDLPRLAEVRAGLRQRMLRSPFGDVERYTRAVEDAYRTIWRRWCERQGRQIPVTSVEAAAEHYRAGRIEEVERLCRGVLEHDPGNAEALHWLGVLALEAGRNETAAELIAKALEAVPTEAVFHNNLGNALKNLGRWREAEESFRRALSLKPEFAEAYNNLGNALKDLGRMDEAEHSYRRALEFKPGFAMAHNNLGGVLLALGRPGEAEQSYRRALELKVDYAEAHYNLGNVLIARRRPREAEQSLRQSIAIKPDYAAAHSNLGNALKDLGRLEEAEQSYRRALALKPDYADAHSNVIFAMDLLERYGVKEQQAERRRWYEQHAQRYAQTVRPHENTPDPERRLRIGYVSSDFRRQSACMIFAPFICLHNRAGFEVICYSGVTREDEMTARLRGAAEGWRSTVGVADDDLAEQVRADRIDILVDLSAHMAGNRLLAFARKPAPIQVTAWGSAPGTGLATMDYLFVDPVSVPLEERGHFAEEVIAMPCALCYEAPAYLPEVSALPASEGRPFTFGCINRPEKISDRVIGLWGRILGELPGAGLLIKGRGLGDAGLRANLLERLGKAGIAPDRVRLEGPTGHLEHLKAFHEVDLVLDPYPHGGGISTGDALAMGVPVVTLSGATPPSRIAASVMTALEMPEWIARSGEEYVRIAVAAARDLPRLAAVRAGLRQRMLRSPFGDVERYTRAVEQAYRTIWRRWCERQGRQIPVTSVEAAAEHYRAGRIEEVERLCRGVLEHDPGNAEALHWLGVLALEAGRNEAAAELIAKALEAVPTEAVFHNNLGNALKNLGRWREAEESFRRALSLKPEFAEAYNNLGNALKDLGRMDEAEHSYRRALEFKPGFAMAHNNLGGVLLALGRPGEAEQSYRRALELKSDYAEAHYNLGNALVAQGRLAEAEPCYRQALTMNGGDAQSHFRLGNILRELGRPGEAEQSLRAALSLNSDFAEAYNVLGNVLADIDRFEEAEQSYRRALALSPDDAIPHSNLGNVLTFLGRLEEAEQCYRRSLALSPGFAKGHNNLGNALRDLGRLEEAEQSYRRALSLKPDYADAHSNVIFAMDLIERYDIREQQAERRRWYERHAKNHGRAIRAHENAPEPERRLRVGYVSADFRRHSSCLAFAPMICLHDRAGFEVICYSGVRREDEVTARLRAAAEGWRSTVGVSDDDLAEQIRGDRIDILVDLSAHMAGNRLLTFARKPAPVQVTAWGSAPGTGLATMDYLFVDPVSVPLEERGHFAEEVIAMPCALCYEAPAYLPEVSALPALSGKPFAFGCINRPEKISERVIGLWGRILREVPGATLLVKGRGLGDAGLQANLLRRLGKAGIAPERVRLEGRTAHGEHLRIFHEVDLVLDPYPHGGGISTGDALAMGVPVVTLMGSTPPSRIAASVMTALEMPEWIAGSDDEYVRIAVAAARDLPRLAAVRAGLRQRMLRSPFGDVGRYTRAVEQAYRKIWRRWCERRAHHAPIPSVETAAEHYRAGRFREAEALCGHILEREPGHPEALHWSSLLALDGGRLEAAAELIGRALAGAPSNPVLHNNLGEAYRRQGRVDDALQCYRRAIALKPNYAQAQFNAGSVLAKRGAVSEAIVHYRAALGAQPDDAITLDALGCALKDRGEIAEAERCFRRALEVRPDLAGTHSNVIFTLDFLEGYGVPEQQAERRRWYERHGRQYAQAIRPHANVPDPGRRLRIGYVSADLRRHSSSFAFAPVICLHDRPDFEVFCYSGVTREDEVTARLRAAAEGWRSTVGVSDDALAEQIRADRIDILVDLSGHSGGNRLLVFARKPAPVQVSAWGNATGTGLRTIDYLFADPIALPSGSRSHFAEQVVDLPCTLCYEPPEYLPQVSALPALSGKPFTFGCINRLEKISDRVIGIWARVLKGVPGARLLIKDRGLEDADLRANFLARLRSAGISPEQVQCRGPSLHPEHLRIFHEVDVALDPFPHGGGCSTAEALSMGAPVVTLLGATLPSRIAASIMTVLGMPEWIASSDEEYVRIAVRAAQDLPRLASIRAGLRQRLLGSAFGDVARYTRAVERAYRSIWRRWCEAQAGRSQGAETDLRQAFELRPDSPQACLRLGDYLRSLGRSADAAEVLRQGVARSPGSAELHFRLGTLWQELGKIDQAARCFNQVVQIQPDHFDAYLALGAILIGIWNLDKAKLALEAAARLKPEVPEVYGNLGTLHLYRGQLREAAENYRHALGLNPGLAAAYSNLLLALNYDPAIAPEALFDEHQRWAERYERPLGNPVRGARADVRRPDPQRRLRVGYVSPDFLDHPAARFFEPILESHDRGQFDVFCYALGAGRDAMTERLERLTKGWRPDTGMSDDQIADEIRADAIDILVDLAGHTRNSRLLVFARKPAPIQIAFLGYPNTTGLASMDYIVTDDVLDPPGEPVLYTEEPIRLAGGFCTFRPPAGAHAISPLPAASSGVLTFGSVHNFAKLNPAVLDLWCEVLRAVPASRLLIYRHTLTPLMQAHVRGLFAQRDIPAERVVLHQATDVGQAFLGGYAMMDVLLDAFPFSGHTTTCESLWMGVPVLTLYGERRAGRMSASVLTQLDLTDWIARTPARFVELAMRASQEIPRLAELRRDLRRRMLASRLCDCAGFTRSLEAVYRRLWGEWCAGSRLRSEAGAERSS